jgi:hypothetical protein
MVVPSLSFGATHNVNNITSLTASLLQGLRREGKIGKTMGNLDPAGMRGFGQRLQRRTLTESATNGYSADRGHYDRLCHGHVGSIGST